MAITELYSVTETVSTTEWSFTTDTAGPDADTTDGVFQFVADFNALAIGDRFEVRVYEKVSSGGTQRLLESWPITLGILNGKPLWVSPAIILMHGWDFTIIKLAGTDRSITGSVRQVA